MAIRRADAISLMQSGGALRRISDIFRGISFDRVLIKLCVGLSLLLILFVWFDISGVLERLLTIDAWFLLLAIGIFSIQFIVSCLRWVLILGRQCKTIGPREALSIFGIGTLANLFLVASVAGMSVRAALLLRAGSNLSTALASVTAERIAAAFGLVLCGAVGFVFALPHLKDHLGQWVWPQSGALAVAGLAISAMVLGVLYVKANWLRTFAQTVWAAFASPGRAIQMIGASAGIVLLGFAGMAVLAAGMDLSVDPIFFLSVMPAVALVSALPISVGGWGVREGAMVAGLAIFSVPAEAAIALSISYGLGCMVVALLFGAALALLGPSKA